MKYLYSSIIIIIIKFALVVNNYDMKQSNLFPILPVLLRNNFKTSVLNSNIKTSSSQGEYRINFKAIIKCNSPKSGIESNFYLSKLSSDRVELRGNFTLKLPFDDNLTFDMNMAIKDSVGGWKDNAHVLKSPNACSTLKNILGTEWRLFIKCFGINSLNCPIAPGVYESSGYDLTAASARSSFPKTFFYGTYKTRFHFSDKLNNAHGCSNFIVEIKRPWEIE